MNGISFVTLHNAFGMMMTGIAKTIAEDSAYGWSDYLPEITLMCNIHQEALKEIRKETEEA